MTRALLITNPFAARADARAVTAILQILGRGGWNVDLRTISGPGDARRIAEESLGEGLDVLVSHGGDGTAMQVAAGIAGSPARSAPNAPTMYSTSIASSGSGPRAPFSVVSAMSQPAAMRP